MNIRLLGAVVHGRARQKLLGPIDLTLLKGLTGIVGPNGAGKSTLLKAICRIMPLAEGSLGFMRGGKPLSALESRISLGYVPQEISVYEDMTLRTYLHYIAGLKGLSKVEAIREITRICAELGLAGLLGERLKEASVGGQRMAMVAQAFLGSPAYVLMDEPFVGLDLERRNALLDFLAGYAERSVVAVASHFTEEMRSGYYNRVISLRDGALTDDFNAE